MLGDPAIGAGSVMRYLDEAQGVRPLRWGPTLATAVYMHWRVGCPAGAAEGYGPSQVIICAPPLPPVAVAPPCKGNNLHVEVPGAPHGINVWHPNHRSAAYQAALANDVIGKDPTLCGASLVIHWSDVEVVEGDFDWSVVTAAGYGRSMVFSGACFLDEPLACS